MEQRSIQSNHPIYHYGIKNISGWGAKSQRNKWNFQRFRKTLTTKTQRHEVLVKRLRMRMVIGHWALGIGKEAEKRRKEKACLTAPSRQGDRERIAHEFIRGIELRWRDK